MHFCQRCGVLKNASAVEVRSSCSQPASNGFLDCVVSLVVMISQVIFHGAEQVVVWGGLNPDCRVDGRAVPRRSFELSVRSDLSKRGIQQEQIFRYPKISIISWTAWCSTPSYSSVPLTVILGSDEVVDFFSCCAQLQQFWVDHSSADRRYSFLVLKVFHPPSDNAGTHAVISRHTTKSVVDDFTRNWMTACWRNDMSVTFIFWQCMTGT